MSRLLLLFKHLTHLIEHFNLLLTLFNVMVRVKQTARISDVEKQRHHAAEQKLRKQARKKEQMAKEVTRETTATFRASKAAGDARKKAGHHLHKQILEHITYRKEPTVDSGHNWHIPR